MRRRHFIAALLVCASLASQATAQSQAVQHLLRYKRPVAAPPPPPTGGTATWNPSDKNSNITLTNSNLTAQGSTGVFGKQLVRSTTSVSSGKHYAEFTITETGSYWLGVCVGSISVNAYLEVSNTGIGAVDADSQVWRDGSYSFNLATNITNGDVVMIAIDRDAGKFWMGINGTWGNSGDPGAGTNGINLPTGTMFLCWAPNEDSTAVMNVGASSFTYSLPSGFSKWP